MFFCCFSRYIFVEYQCHYCCTHTYTSCCWQCTCQIQKFRIIMSLNIDSGERVGIVCGRTGSFFYRNGHMFSWCCFYCVSYNQCINYTGYGIASARTCWYRYHNYILISIRKNDDTASAFITVRNPDAIWGSLYCRCCSCHELCPCSCMSLNIIFQDCCINGSACCICSCSCKTACDDIDIRICCCNDSDTVTCCDSGMRSFCSIFHFCKDSAVVYDHRNHTCQCITSCRTCCHDHEKNCFVTGCLNQYASLFCRDTGRSSYSCQNFSVQDIYAHCCTYCILGCSAYRSIDLEKFWYCCCQNLYIFLCVNCYFTDICNCFWTRYQNTEYTCSTGAAKSSACTCQYTDQFFFCICIQDNRTFFTANCCSVIYSYICFCSVYCYIQCSTCCCPASGYGCAGCDQVKFTVLQSFYSYITISSNWYLLSDKCIASVLHDNCTKISANCIAAASCSCNCDYQYICWRFSSLCIVSACSTDNCSVRNICVYFVLVIQEA